MTTIEANPAVATEWHHPDRIRPSALAKRESIARSIDRLPWPVRRLAPVPAGSDLKPVMGTPGLPFIGRSADFFLDGPGVARRSYDRFGPVSWSRMFGVNSVLAAGPEASQAVLTNANKAFSQSGWDYFIGPFFNRGLMLLDFEEHLLHRRIMQEAFTRNRLAGYLQRVDARVQTDLTRWPANGQIFAYPTLKRLSLDIATDIFMGGEGGGEDAVLQRAFVDSVRAGTSLIRRPAPGGRWKRGLDGRVVLEDYFRSRVPAKRAIEAADDADLFAALCHAQTDEGETFSDDDVVNHMIFMMMAAHDTTTITTSAVLAALAEHPEWQERAREQSLAVAGELSLDALDGLTVLDLVIKEALRLVAPVPGLARKTVKDTDLLGHYIPAGTQVMVSPWLNHYLPEYWSDPERFDPERFAEPRREDKSHRFAWMPFGGGAHKCIGMYFGTQEVKTLVHHLLLSYRWSTPEGYRVPWDLVSLPMPADGLPLQFEQLGSSR